MRISLLHNPDAGDGVSFEEVHRDLSRAGYEVVREIEKDSDFERVLEEPVAFVVAAGGDGTVRKAARALAGSGVPLAILPLGTANNIARSIGVPRPASAAIARWRDAEHVPFDLGVARGQWGESRFLEGVGSGLIPAGIAADEEHPAHGSQGASEELTRSLRSYAHTLDRLHAWKWTVRLDDRQIEGELLLLEILNIPSVGANLVLAPDADPSDGFFDVVTAGEAQREELSRFLLDRIAGKDARIHLPTRRARRIEAQGLERLHVDDEVRKIKDTGTVTVEIEPGGAVFLI